MGIKVIVVHDLDEVDALHDIDTGNVVHTELEVDKNRNFENAWKCNWIFLKRGVHERVKWFSKTGLIKEAYLVLIDVNEVVGIVDVVEIVVIVVYVEYVELDVDNELKNINAELEETTPNQKKEQQPFQK